jgi:hypothetical protein
VLRLRIQAVGYKSFAYIVAKAYHDRLIRRILPHRIAATHCGNMKKVVWRRRRRHRPFQPSVSPRIVSSDFTNPPAAEDVGQKYK